MKPPSRPRRFFLPAPGKHAVRGCRKIPRNVRKRRRPRDVLTVARKAQRKWRGRRLDRVQESRARCSSTHYWHAGSPPNSRNIPTTPRSLAEYSVIVRLRLSPSWSVAPRHFSFPFFSLFLSISFVFFYGECSKQKLPHSIRRPLPSVPPAPVPSFPVILSRKTAGGQREKPFHGTFVRGRASKTILPSCSRYLADTGNRVGEARSAAESFSSGDQGTGTGFPPRKKTML